MIHHIRLMHRLEEIILACPQTGVTWWRHQMETFSALLALCEGNPRVTVGFPTQRPVSRSFDIFFDLRLNIGRAKRLWFETQSRSFRRHCSVIGLFWPNYAIRRHRSGLTLDHVMLVAWWHKALTELNRCLLIFSEVMYWAFIWGQFHRK